MTGDAWVCLSLLLTVCEWQGVGRILSPESGVQRTRSVTIFQGEDCRFVSTSAPASITSIAAVVLRVNWVAMALQGPELLVGLRDYDYSLDIWSLGCTFAGMVRTTTPGPRLLALSACLALCVSLATRDSTVLLLITTEPACRMCCCPRVQHSVFA